MKILILDDKQGTAIDILANFIKRHNSQHEIDIMPFHPKRPDEDTVSFLREHWKDYDLIHWMYWRSWEKAHELIPEIDNAVSVLSHFNPYDVDKYEWNNYHNINVICLESQRESVPYAEIVRLSVDENLWIYEPNNSSSLGVCANRIESSKGIKEVAEVADELGRDFHVMGRVSKPDYWQEVLKHKSVKSHLDVSFDRMPDIYHKMGIYVCNSQDNFETGPMPPIEAMLSGVPVVSRKVGTIGEVFSDKEVLFYDTKDDMKKAIKKLDDNEFRKTLTQNAWNEAKSYNSYRFAREYNEIYHRTLYPNSPLVSIIIPTIPDRLENIQKIKESIVNQNYKNVEIIIEVDNEDGYNLAKSRNKAIVKSHGQYLLFLDDRLRLKDEAINKFVDQHENKEKLFLWGNKGAGRRRFIENFSFCRRQDLINAGMFNERIDCYGGMSQEIRTRLERQDWEFGFCEAEAEEVQSSKSKWNRKSDIIKAKNIIYSLGL